MSTLLEHEILAAGFISTFWKCFFNFFHQSSILVPILGTISSIVALYFTFAIDQRWPSWNCDKPNFWIHQLKNVNRQPQNLGLWCIFLSLFSAFLSIRSISVDQHDYFHLIILIMICCPLISRLILFNLSRKWKLSILVSEISSIFLNFYFLRSIFSFQFPAIVFLSTIPSLLNSFLTPKLMTSVPKSFTLGEYYLIISSVLISILSSIRLIFSITYVDGESESILVLSAWSILACVTFSIICFSCSIVRKSAIVFWFSLLLITVIAYLLCLFWNHFDLLSFFVDFLLFDIDRRYHYRRWILLIFWLLCVACTLRFAAACWSMPRLGTVHRKYFHLTIGFVSISGLVYDRSLTVLASILILDGFVVLEIIRLCEIEPIGKSIREIFAKFLDHQDQGPLVLTPVYLLIGIFVPIWIDLSIIDSSIDKIALRHFAGLIAVGVGDAAAAIGGTYFGRTPWRSSRKTVQGTVCGFLAQVAACFFVLHLIGDFATLGLGKIIWLVWSCFLISMLETFSAQVDNLVLPLFAFLLFLGL